jgi:tRNA pseudouridine38-40 synthase
MNRCAALFVGTHDWTAFSAAQCESENRVRTVSCCVFEKQWNERAQSWMFQLKVTANGFLRYMVRSIAGTLLAAGRNEVDGSTIQTAIKEGDRTLSGATAPACGLTLLSVRYD